MSKVSQVLMTSGAVIRLWSLIRSEPELLSAGIILQGLCGRITLQGHHIDVGDNKLLLLSALGYVEIKGMNTHSML
jgi:hypothetical protein